MNKSILATASFLGMTAIILGAFAAHGLEKLINAESIETFKTGVQYQMYHALFLFALGILDCISIKTKKVVFSFVIVGLLFFSGSIYGLATNTLTSFNFKTIALITPVGGLVLILAWCWLGVSILKSKKNK